MLSSANQTNFFSVAKDVTLPEAVRELNAIQ